MQVRKSHQAKLKNAKLDAQRAERRAILEPVVLGVVSALGGYEDVLIKKQPADGPEGNPDQDLQTERVYKLGDECLGCLKDLKKFWRLDEDDENRTVARILQASQILPNDLLPILLSIQTNSKKDHRVALLTSDLIAALTWPIDIAAELQEAFEIEDEESRRRATNIDYSSLLDAQLSYKRHIVRTGACGPIFRLILPAIQKNKNERTEKDENIISLILHIIRNLLAIRDKAPPTGQSTSGTEESQVQSNLIMQLSKFGVFDLLIHMSHGSNRFDEYGQWNMIVLDIWHMLFRGVNSEGLIDAEVCVGTNEVGETISSVKQSDKELESLLLGEEQVRKARARKSSTRHSRFGTTLSVNAGDKRFTLTSQSAITTPVEIALDVRKQQGKIATRLEDEFGRPTYLTPDALKVLRNVVIEFIESGFNPFFLSVLKDLQAQRAQDTNAVRLLSLLGFFLKCFLKLREREKSVGILPTSETGHDFDLVADLIEPECLLWVVTRIGEGLEVKPESTVEVHAGVDCVIQQLLVIEGLCESGVEEYTQAANVILNKLYYDSDTLDMVIKLMSQYNSQSLKYLENIVHFSFVFLKILERYSQTTDYMYVRKKKSNRKSTKQQPLPNPVNGDVEEEDIIETGGDPIDEEEQAVLDAEQSHAKFSEHKFEFGKFQFRFATAAVVDTLMTYLRGYRNFADPELMKRVVKLMYRQAVGAEAYKLFFRVSILDTFNSMIEDRAFMPKHPIYTDLIRFIDYILKQYFKCMAERPFLIVETLFNHTKKEWDHACFSSDDSDMPDKLKTSRKVPKLPAEIVVKPGLRWSHRFGVAVGVLVDKGQSDFIEKVKDILRLASASRAAISLMNDEGGDDTGIDDIQAWIDHPHDEITDELKDQLHQPSRSTLEKFEDHRVCAEEDAKDFSEALARNAQLHTLLRLLHWESEEENPGFLSWIIPKNRPHSELDMHIRVIDYFLINTLDLNGKTAADYTKRKRKVAKRKSKRPELTAEELALDASSGDDAPAQSTKKKRKATKRRSRRSELDDSSADDDDDDAEKAKKTARRSRKQKETQQYRSAQFVADSDDEENEERDRLFFEQEQILKAQLNQAAMARISKPVRPKKSRKRKIGAADQEPRPAEEKPPETPGEEQDRLSSPSSSSSPILEVDSHAEHSPERPNPTTLPPSSPSSLGSPIPVISRRKRDVEEMIEELDKTQGQGNGSDTDGARKAFKSRRLFIGDSDDE